MLPVSTVPSRSGGDGEVRQAGSLACTPRAVGKDADGARRREVDRQHPHGVKVQHRLQPRRQPVGLAVCPEAAAAADALLHLGHRDDEQEQRVAVALHPGQEVWDGDILGGRARREDVGVHEVHGSQPGVTQLIRAAGQVLRLQGGGHQQPPEGGHL